MRIGTKSKLIQAVGAVVLATLASSRTARAATYTWARGVGNTTPGYSWINSTAFGSTTNGNNWNNVLVPNYPTAAGDVANLTPSAGGSAELINLDANITIGVLNTGSGNSSTGAVTLASSGPTNPQAFVLTLNNNASDASITHNTTNAVVTINTPLSLAGNGNLSITNNNTSTTTTFLIFTNTLTSALASGTQTVTFGGAGLTSFNGAISNGLAGGTIALRSTAGVTTLGGVNLYTGGTTLAGGALVATNNSSFGSGSITVNANSGSQVRLASGVDLANSISIAGGGAVSQGVIFGPASGSATYSGSINITGNANSGGHFASAGGTLNVNGAITASVPVTIRTGTVVLNNAANSFSSLNIQAGTFKIGAAGALPTGAAVDMGVSGGALFDVNGFSPTLGGLTRTTNAATLTNTGAIDSTVTVSAGNSTFGGIIQDGATNKIALTVSGGSLNLSGANTFTGATNVSGGTLALSGTGSINNTPGIAVNGAGARFRQNSTTAVTPAISLTQGTLDGNGTVGAVTVNGTGGVVSNGTGALGDTSTLTASSVSFTSSGKLSLNKANDISTVALNVINNLDTSVGGITLDIPTAPSWVNNTTYNLISYGSFTGSDANFSVGSIAGLGARQSATVGNTGPTSGFITLSITGDFPYWTGAASDSWTTATVGSPKNWKLFNANTNTDFLTSDQVLFDDNATGATAVNITDPSVTVASATFNNSLKNYTISGGAIAGSGASLTKNGTGTLVLLNTNTYTGVTTINAGTLQVGDGTTDGSISASASITNNGSLIYNRSTGSNFTYSGIISGTGSLTKSGGGTQILSAANTYTGGTIVSGGTLVIGADNNLGASASPVTLDGGTLRTSAGITNTHAVTIGASGGTINIPGNGQYYFHTANTLLGSGNLTLSGTGTLTPGFGNLRIDQTNTYNGAATVTGGGIFEYGIAAAVDPAATFNIANEAEIAVQNATALPNAITVSGGTNSVLSFENGNTGDFSGPVTLNGNAIVGLRDWYNNATVRGGTISGAITGTGGITVNSGTGTGGTLTLSNTSNSYSGGTTISNANVRISSDSALGTGPLTLNVGTLELLGTNTTSGSRSVTLGGASSASTLQIDAASTYTLSGPISGTGGFRKLGAGTLVISADNPGLSGTALMGTGGANQPDAGALRLTSSGALGSALINMPATNNSPMSIELANNINVANSINSSSREVTGGGAAIPILKNVSDSNTYSGTLTITATGGSVGLQSDSGTLNVNGTIINNAGSQRGLQLMGAGNGQINTSLASNTSFRVQKDGAGTWTLGSAATDYTGTTIVNAGTLNFNGSLRTGSSMTIADGAKAAFAPRTTGGKKTLQVGTLSIAATGSLDLADNDLVVDTGSYTQIRAWVLQGVGPSTTGIDSSTSTGNTRLALFDNAQQGLSSWNGGTIAANAVVGKYTYFGDVNIDGQVTGDDYTVVDSNLNTTPPVGLEWLRGDANTDGTVTGDDYTVIDANLGSGVGNPLSASSLGGGLTPSSLAVVPEPASFGILVAGAGLLLARRRRSS